MGEINKNIDVAATNTAKITTQYELLKEIAKKEKIWKKEISVTIVMIIICGIKVFNDVPLYFLFYIYN